MPGAPLLVLNCGSTSVKFTLFAGDAGDAGDAAPRALLHGAATGLGGGATPRIAIGDEEPRALAAVGTGHAGAVHAILDALRTDGALAEAPVAVGHRVVHGGAALRRTTRIDPRTRAQLDDATLLAPLHNAPALAAVDAIGEALPWVPQFAVFDTTFHATMPPRAARYAIPADLADRHALYRFGFHGIAHQDMVERASALAGRAPGALRLVTLQLGGGASAAAIDRGRSVDTTMGLTPLEGLMMATRSGDVDPSLVNVLGRRAGMSADAVEHLLNERSGLLGVSGRSSDARTLLAAEREGDAASALALEMFCYRVRKQIGAYAAALGGVDGVVFGGGIGEHAPELRARILAGLEWAGIRLDAARNAATTREGMIGADGAPVFVCVIAVDEARLIARETFAALAG